MEIDRKTKWLLFTYSIIPIIFYLIGLCWYSDKPYGLGNPALFTLIFTIPVLVGCTTLYLSSHRKARKNLYRIFFPWLIYTIIHFAIIFFIGLIGKAFEWQIVKELALMSAITTGYLFFYYPLLLFAASIGGIIGGFIKTIGNC